MTYEQKIRTAAAFAGVSLSELARRINQSPQNFNSRLKTGKFTEKEMEAIASAMNANFEPCAFVFTDGTKI